MQFTIGGYTDVVSPLDLIQRILAAGSFSALPMDQPKSGEVVLGVLTDEEKAIVTANLGMIDYLASFAPKLNEFGKLKASELSQVKNEATVLLDQCEKAKKWGEILNELFWISVQTRFAEELLAAETKNLAVRAGFQIVIMKKAPPLGLFASLDELLGGGEAHNCALCPNYDGCILPFRIQRRKAPASQTAP